MATNAPAAYGVYAPSVALHEVLQTLGEGGFEKEGICMMLSPSHPIATTVRESGGLPFEQIATTGAAALVAWLSEFGAVVIPTFGFFINSCKFFQSLVTERSSIAPCGSGTLISLGFPEDDAQRFETQVREAGALLYVPCGNTVQMQWTLELLRATGAQETGLLECKTAMESVA